MTIAGFMDSILTDHARFTESLSVNSENVHRHQSRDSSDFPPKINGPTSGGGG